MKRILRLPVNERWYKFIENGELTYDYREIKPFWQKRLENKEYDVVELYHRFNKAIKPLQFTFEWIKKSKLTDYNNLPVYIIKFGERIN